ncbi:MAG: DUF308 domain-containing protein [Clostridium sp.]|nr:DUF308 domain-containing protein [Clostridium sp.]MCM1387369.1 DUF308 domain-containing protein [Bacillus sp. (in: firmicutes)]MCM1427201.1 DUF308 domain-containing protein [Eubacterium sp.]
MERILKKIRTNVVISALICIALGVVLVVWPGMSVQIACMAIGAVLVLNGISRLLNFIFERDGSLFSQMNLIMGIIITVIGVYILLQPSKIIAMIPILVGIIIIIHGVNNLQQAVSLCKGQYDKWWVALILGLLTVGFGILLICNPFEAIDTLVMFIGLFLIYDGVSDIWIVSRVSYTAKQVKQELGAIDVEAKE